MGGTWERKIASVRRVLEASFALTSNRSLSRDEFCTFLAESSSIINHTPMWSTSSNPNDPNPLTPSMLLTLREASSDNTRDEYAEADLLAYGSRRYRRIQYLSDQFWIRWKRDYLQQLTKRHKWRRRQPCVSPGDVVLVRDKQTPRNHWPLGRVQSVKYSDDGLVRSVNMVLHKPGSDFQQRSLSRPISELVLLVPSASHRLDPVCKET